ncbi:MAG: 1-phosphofructokinase family hexose kinase, partial [Fibrobacterota bacterium]
MIFTTLLNPSIDVIYPLQNTEPGRTYRSVDARQYPAGKGLNVAKAVRLLDEDVHLCGVIPEYSHNYFTTFCKDLGIETTLISTPGECRINTTITEDQSNIITHINSESKEISPGAAQNLLQEISRLMAREAGIWCFSGSTAPGFPDRIYGDLISRAREHGLVTAADTRGILLKYALQQKPTIISPNITELEEINAEPVEGVRHMALKGKRLIDEGISHVFITLGDDGVI